MAKKKTTKKKATTKSAAKKQAAKPARKPAKASKAAIRPSKPKRGTPKRPAAMFQKIAFTMIPAKDPTRARAFYEQVLGLERGLASPDGVWTEYDLPGGGCLALFWHPDPAIAREPGGGSVAFEVADLDALNVRLSAAGVVYQSGIIHGPKCRMSNIQDSEGNALILHEFVRNR